MKQLSFFNSKTPNDFGGSLIGKRKSARPLNFKMPHHFVLKAMDPNRLLRNTKAVEAVIRKFSKRFGVDVYALAVQCDHIHLNVRLTNRVLYRRWIRALTSSLVTSIPGLKFGLRPFSKIISWGRQFMRVNRYILGNQSEADFIFMAHRRVAAFLNAVTRPAKAQPLFFFSK